jgi:hypothetical protein
MIGQIGNTVTPNSNTDIVIATDDECSNKVLNPGLTCTITYQLQAGDNPTGDYTNLVSIPYNNMNESPLQEEFSFSIMESAAILGLSSETIEPLEVGQAETVTFTLTNYGNADADNVTPTINQDYGFIALTAGTCGDAPFNVNANSSCTLTYTITPPVVGMSSQYVQINYDVIPNTLSTTSSLIEFYSYTPAPENAYFPLSTPVGSVLACSINEYGYFQNCVTPVSVLGVSAIDFTEGYGFTSAISQSGNAKVNSCDTNPFVTCNATTSTGPVAASYGSFIKFYNANLAYLSNFQGAPSTPNKNDSVLLCDVNASENTINCNNNYAMQGPSAIALLKLNSTSQYAYVLNKTNTALNLCTINPSNGTFTQCVDSGTANLFASSVTLDFVSAGEIYAYVPLQVSSNKIDILQCQVNTGSALGTLSACVTAKSFSQTSPISVSAMKVVSLGAPDVIVNPILYIGISYNGSYSIESCNINPNGGLQGCYGIMGLDGRVQGINVM